MIYCRESSENKHGHHVDKARKKKKNYIMVMEDRSNNKKNRMKKGKIDSKKIKKKNKNASADTVVLHHGARVSLDILLIQK